MNSMSSANIPAKKPILEMFDLAMDEKMLDYLIAMGTKPHTVGQLRNGYHSMYGGTKEDWEKISIASSNDTLRAATISFPSSDK